jgi:hypothetical protein
MQGAATALPELPAVGLEPVASPMRRVRRRHPRMWQRAFVLLPLAEIAPELVSDLHLQAVQHQKIVVFEGDFGLWPIKNGRD